jgi:hypothetical protein
MTTDIQRIDKIAKRDGLDLIWQELTYAGLEPVIENTGGFHLWVAVYGDKGYLVANNEAVFFYSNGAEFMGEGQDLKYRDEYQDADSWAGAVLETFTNHTHRVGTLREMVECPEHNGGFDCTPFCKTCGGEQGYYPSEVTK